MHRGLTIHAEHIPGVYNTVADAESRQRFESSDSTAQQTAPLLFQLQTRPRSGGSGCSGSVLVSSETLRFSSICSDREMSSEVGAGTGERISIDSTNVAQPDMVSNSSDQAHRPSNLVARFQEDHHKSSGRDTSTDRAKQPVPGPLQSFRMSIQEQGISDESFRIISAAWRKGTEKHTHQHGESGYFGVIEQILIPFHHLSDLFLDLLTGSFMKANSTLP